MKNENRTGDILLLLLVLAFAVVVVDEWWLRTLVAVVPALLLAQKAAGAGGGAETGRVGLAERRSDLDTRDSIDQLLKLIREFYLTCHLMGKGGLDPEEALERVAEQEIELNGLLARVTDGARATMSTDS